MLILCDLHCTYNNLPEITRGRDREIFDEIVREHFGDLLDGQVLGDDVHVNLWSPAAGDQFFQVTIELLVVIFPEML